MPDESNVRRRAPTLFIALLLAAACNSDRATRPNKAPSSAAAGTASESTNGVLLANNVRPLIAASLRKDSAAFPIRIAESDLVGLSGDTVSVILRSDASVLESAGSSVELLVEINGTTSRFPLAAITQGVVVYRFTTNQPIKVRYSLTRSVSSVAQGVFELRQKTTARVLTTNAPWVLGDGTETQMASSCTMNCGPWTCTIGGSSFGSCGPSVWVIAPWTPGSPFCCFQSNTGTGASNPITITFSEPIDSISVIIQDPTYDGNTMTAYGPSGQTLAVAAFSFSGQPGNNQPDTVSLTGVISKIVLTPAPADYVAYSATIRVSLGKIVVTCTGPVARGSSVSCTAAADPPASTLAVTAWSFTSNVGAIRVDRAVDPTSTTWAGQLVVNGKVLVEGTVDGDSSFGTANISVTARSWLGKTTVKDHTVIATTLNSRPATVEELGNTGLEFPLDPNVSRWLATISDNGPNNEFSYLIELPPITTSESQVNTKAINDTSSFYRVQEPKRKKINGVWFCPKSVVWPGVLLNLVTQHEGAVTNPDTYPNSHSGIFRHHVDSLAYLRFEPVTAFQSQDAVTPVATALFNEAFNDSQAMDGDSRNYVNDNSLGNCHTFHFDYSQLPP